MSIPYSRSTRTTFGCSGLGWLPALATSMRPARCRSNASATGERALLPVHKNSTLQLPPGPAACTGVSRNPGCSASPAALSASAQVARSRW